MLTCSFCCCYYYWGYCHYCDYFAGKCTAWDIEIERISAAQGPFRTIQLFSVLPHQAQWCAAGLLQPVPCETTLRQSPIGPRYDSASRYWQWCIHGHARSSVVRTGFAPFLCLRQTDTGSKSFDCALVSTLETYVDPENGNHWYYCYYCCHCIYLCLIKLL